MHSRRGTAGSRRSERLQACLQHSLRRVYAGESFPVSLYARTDSNSLDAYRVELYYNATLLSMCPARFRDGDFNSMLFQDEGSYLILYPVGKPSTVADAATTGNAISLATVQMRFKGGTATGTHTSCMWSQP